MTGAQISSRHCSVSTANVCGQSKGCEEVHSLTQDVEKAPRPSDKRLQVRDCKGDLFAVRIFGGSPSAAQVQEERQELSRLANEEGTKIADGEWLFARYNDKQWPLGPFRRNEVLLPINEATFDLWRGVKWDFVDRTVARKV